MRKRAYNGRFSAAKRQSIDVDSFHVDVTVIGDPARSLAVYVRAEDTVRTLKRHVHLQVADLAPAEQVVHFADRRLADTQTLGDVGVTEGSAVVVGRRGREMGVLIHELSGGYSWVDVLTSDTIDALKQKIAVIRGIPAGQQRLIFGGRALVDERMLSDYNIQRDSIVSLMLSLRGD